MSRYIDTDTAIEDFERWKENPVKDKHDRIWNAAINTCINDVKNHIPPADVAEVRHGKWIVCKIEAEASNGDIYEFDDNVAECSECGNFAHVKADTGYFPKFCDNCGAKMDTAKPK